MRKLLRFVVQEVLYIFDPFFRVTVQRKGPNDKVGCKEKVSAVITHSDGSKRTVRRER